MRAFFDADAFFVALDQICEARGGVWYDLFLQTGIGYATCRKWRRNRCKPDADTLATLIVWSGLDANLFMKQEVAE